MCALILILDNPREILWFSYAHTGSSIASNSAENTQGNLFYDIIIKLM